MKRIVLFLLLGLAALYLLRDDSQHLFILSGQSNMHGLQPQESFRPAVEKAFGKKHVIIVQHAAGGAGDSALGQEVESRNGRPAENKC